jgi:ADP-L-glycero-D-manno-heptose 6-epimerase
MMMVTGGAGFIGSNLHAALARREVETVVVDWLGERGKWRNLAKHPPARLIPPEALDDFLATHPPLEALVHLGAVSETTATDADHAWASNVELPLRLWRWCAARGVRLIYASSAATYGDGSAGFEDDLSLAALRRLRPLNLYGWTKHAFDLCVAHMLVEGEPRPPQWAGLKFFNVYGPNEYHKGGMVSVVKVKHDELVSGQPVRLFRSDRAGLADGAQARDFVWVGDAGRERPVQRRHRPRPHLSRPRARRVRLRRAGARHRLHRHAPGAARAVPGVHRSQHGAAPRGRLPRPVHLARRRNPVLHPDLSHPGRPVRVSA